MLDTQSPLVEQACSEVLGGLDLDFNCSAISAIMGNPNFAPKVENVLETLKLIEDRSEFYGFESIVANVNALMREYHDSVPGLVALAEVLRLSADRVDWFAQALEDCREFQESEAAGQA